MKVCPVCQRCYGEDCSLCAADQSALVPAPESAPPGALLTAGLYGASGIAVSPLAAAGVCPPVQPRRKRVSFTILFLTLAFALGAVASLWLFKRVTPAATLPPLAHQTTTEATDTTPQHSLPPTPAAEIIKSAAVYDAKLPPPETGHATGVADARHAAGETRAGAGAPESEGRKAAHPRDVVKEAPPGGPARTPAAERAITTQPTPAGRDAGGGRCALATSKSRLTLRSGGGAAEVAVSLGSLHGATAINASTGDWANIVVFPGARRGGVATYRIVSVSRRPGTYGVTFSSPCGAKHIAVTVE